MLSKQVNQELGQMALDYLSKRTHPLSEFVAIVLKNSYTNNVSNDVLFEQFNQLAPTLLKNTGVDAYRTLHRAMIGYVKEGRVEVVEELRRILEEQTKLLSQDVDYNKEFSTYTPFSSTGEGVISSEKKGLSLFGISVALMNEEITDWAMSFYDESSCKSDLIDAINLMLNEHIFDFVQVNGDKGDKIKVFYWLIQYACNKGYIDAIINNSAIAKYLHNNIMSIPFVFDCIASKDPLLADRVLNSMLVDDFSLTKSLESEMRSFFSNLSSLYDYRDEMKRCGGYHNDSSKYKVSNMREHKEKVFTALRWYRDTGANHPFMKRVLQNADVMNSFIHEGIKSSSQKGYYRSAFKSGTEKGLRFIIRWRNSFAGDLFFAKQAGSNLAKLKQMEESVSLNFIYKLYAKTIPIEFWLKDMKTGSQLKLLLEMYNTTPMEVLNKLPEGTSNNVKKVIINEISQNI